jgi:hypothetical protein
MFDELVFESECDVLIALGNCLYKEALMRDYSSDVTPFMEDGEQSSSNNGQSWWQRISAWFRKSVETVLNFFLNLPQRIANFFKKVPQVSDTAKEEIKRNGKKYPHCVVNQETGDPECQVPKALLDAFEIICDDSDDGIRYSFEVISEIVIKCVESNGSFNFDYDKNTIQSLRSKIEQVKLLVNQAKQGKGELTTFLVNGSANDIMSHLNAFAKKVRASKIKTNLDTLNKIAQSKNENVSSTATAASKQFVEVTNYLLQTIGQLNAVLTSSLNMYQKELNAANAATQNQDAQTPTNDQQQPNEPVTTSNDQNTKPNETPNMSTPETNQNPSNTETNNTQTEQNAQNADKNYHDDNTSFKYTGEQVVQFSNKWKDGSFIDIKPKGKNDFDFVAMNRDVAPFMFANSNKDPNIFLIFPNPRVLGIDELTTGKPIGRNKFSSKMAALFKYQFTRNAGGKYTIVAAIISRDHPRKFKRSGEVIHES